MPVPVNRDSGAAPALVTCLAFNPGNQLAVRQAGNRLGLAFVGPTAEVAEERLAAHFPRHTAPAEYFTVEAGGARYRAFFTQVDGAPADAEVRFFSLEAVAARRADLAPSLAAVVDGLEPHLIGIPYLHLGENEYIYRFRVEKERNHGIYAQDAVARALYQSRLCEAIKAINRIHERSAAHPAVLDFGPVRYVIPSHFGFCLGVKNAIERAYETLAENPGPPRLHAQRADPQSLCERGSPPARPAVPADRQGPALHRQRPAGGGRRHRGAACGTPSPAMTS